MDDFKERLTRMETTLNRIDNQLFGNGQPGLLEKLNTRIVILEAKKSELQGSIGTLKILATIGPLVAGGLISVVEYMLHTKYFK